MLRLAIVVAPLEGALYLPGDLVYLSAEVEGEEMIRVHHVTPSRAATSGAWARPSALIFAPPGVTRDDMRLALAAHRIALVAQAAPNPREVAEAIVEGLLGKPTVS